jgi:hypothetical protein
MKLFAILSSCLVVILVVVSTVVARGINFHSEGGGPFVTDDKSTRSEGKRKDEFGIREVVPTELRFRYQKWKDELLSTEFGRRQWERYANNKDFLLKIVVSSSRKFGAGTDDFEWDENGKLVSATITLGKNLDRGFPDPVYYPVMNSLATYDGMYEVGGDILASTKIVHEIGHVNFTAEANSNLFQRQNRLMASYNSIFLKNGYNTKDERLLALASELGARPIEIWEEREYQSEVDAMRFLLERISKETFFCSVYDRMRRNISEHARNYRDRFQSVSDLAPAACRN